MNHVQYLQLVALMGGFVVLEYLLGRAKRFKVKASDNLLDLVGFGLLAALTWWGKAYDESTGAVPDTAPPQR